MADEITLSVSVRVSNGFFLDNVQPPAIQIDQAVIGRFGHSQIIGQAAPEVVDLGDVDDNGILYLRNLDTTNYIEYGPQSDAATIEVFGRLLAGEFAVMRVSPAIIIWAQADTTDCILDVKMYEN